MNPAGTKAAKNAGETYPTFADPTAEAAFPGNEDERVTAIYEVAAGLTGRQRDVFDLMMDKHARQKGGPTGKQLAEKWGVNEMTISRDQKKILRMIRERIVANEALDK